jgi:hypothetical protein
VCAKKVDCHVCHISGLQYTPTHPHSPQKQGCPEFGTLVFLLRQVFWCFSYQVPPREEHWATPQRRRQEGGEAIVCDP